MRDRDFDISAKEKLECMDYFAKGEMVRGRKFVYGGFFWPTAEENLRDSLSLILNKLMKKEQIETVKEEFSKLIENKNYKPQGKSVYMKGEVIWHKPRDLFKKNREASFYRFRDKDFMNLVAGYVSTPGEIGRSSGFVFLRVIEGFQEERLEKNKLLELRKKLVGYWKDLTGDKEARDYLEKVIKVHEMTEDLSEEDRLKSPVFKLLSYLAPFNFTTFEGAVILSKVGLFERKKTPEELLQELKNYEKQEGKDYGKVWMDLEWALKDRGLSVDWLKDLLEKAHHKDFLKKLRKDWKEVLKKLLKDNNFKGAFVEKGEEMEGKLSYGVFSVPDKEVEVYVFYEESLKKDLEDFRRGFQKAVNDFKGYTGGIELKIEIKKEWSIKGLIPNFDKLKEEIDYSRNPLGNKDSQTLLFNLLYFIARLKSFVKMSQKRQKPQAILLLLDTDVREEGGGYPFWNYFALAYDFFSLPVQTLNKETIKKFGEYGKGKVKKETLQGVYKNLFISLMKDLKSLEFEFEGFSVPSSLKLFVVLEKPSAGFCYEKGVKSEEKIHKHYLYEVYLVQIVENKVKVELEDKFIILAGGVDFERQRLTSWIEGKVSSGNTTRFCFITAGEDSYIRDVIKSSSLAEQIESKSLFVEYDELAIAYLSDKAHKDCFVIYTSEFEELRKRLGIESQKHTVSLALKPADPKSERFALPDGERFYHSSLQVFSTQGPGWEKDEVYMEKKSLFLLTVLALSQYESESFITPYAKLELWQKQKNLYIELRRNQGNYVMGLSGVLYELLYLATKVPPLDNNNLPQADS